MPGQYARWLPSGVESTNENFSGQLSGVEVRNEPVEDSAERRLPAATWTSDHNELAFFHFKVNVTEGWSSRSCIRERKILDLDDWQVFEASQRQ